MTDLYEMDLDAAFNMRDWLREALESKGAKITASGMGLGGNDLWIQLEGFEYFITMKPIFKND